MVNGGGQRDNDIGDDIGQHDVEAAAGQLLFQRLVYKIGGYSSKAVGAKAIYLGVFGGSSHSHLVDIYPNSFLGAQHQCGNGKNAAAGTHIQYARMFNGELLQQLAAQAGGVVGAAAKGHAGVGVYSSQLGHTTSRLPRWVG